MLTLIAAAGENNELGKDNDLPWHLPDDFKRFKKLTTGHHILMGRRTFESFPQPLPDRTHVVITRRENYKKGGIIVVHSIERAVELSKDDPQPFIIGVVEIIKISMDIDDENELRRIHGTFEADTLFPEIDEKDWKLVAEKFHEKDEKHAYAFTYLTYER